MSDQGYRYAQLAAYADELKRALRETICAIMDQSASRELPELKAECARLLASDPRNPERLEARARHDSFVAALKSEEPMDTITPDASGIYDEESWR